MALAQNQSRPFRVLLRLIGVVALLSILICFGILLYKWPFTRKAATAALQHEIGSPVRIGAFHATFSPPGYVAENISFVGDASRTQGPELTVRKLVVVASPLDLLILRKRVERVLIVGLRLTLPDRSVTNRKSAPPRFSEIGQLELEDAVVKFVTSEPAADPLTLAVTKMTVNHVSRTRPASFTTDFHVNKPEGAVHVTGQIGPWNWQDMGRTPVTGAFALPDTDLSTYGGITGSLKASGRFTGPLSRILCTGSVDVPNFQVSKSSHSVDLSTTFRASVDGLNGDITIDRAQSHFNRTIIDSQGSIKEDARRSGKIASLRLSIEEGQIGDVLLLFTRAPQPSMAGTVDLRLDVEIPPGPPGFLKKVSLNGEFGIDRGRFTKSKAQIPIDHLSESAAGMTGEEREQSRETVLSDVAGHISIEHGSAELSHISFAVPGAHGALSGTYNVLNQAVNLEGHLLTTGDLSSAASGFKAVMLKVVTPFLKKHSVTTVPFTITGTAQHPTFALDLMNKHRS